MIKNITVYGTGVIGTAWGACFLKEGYHVTFYDIDEEKLKMTKKDLQGIMQFFFSMGMISEEEVNQSEELAVYTTDVETAVRDADFIQENCPENVELKRSVIQLIEKHCREDAIIASSTSGLLVSDIAAGAKHPERIIDGHPYNPVYIMPLVEVSKGTETKDEYVEAAMALYKSIGKEPVLLNKETPGFICNRIQVAVFRECYDLVQRGVCSVEDVDKAVTYGVGMRWAILGPHLVAQVGGGAGGFKKLNEGLAPATKVWLEDMAKWTEYPTEYTPIAERGIAEEMADRAPGTGQNTAELAAYLVKGCMHVLKFHGKL